MPCVELLVGHLRAVHRREVACLGSPVNLNSKASVAVRSRDGIPHEDEVVDEVVGGRLVFLYHRCGFTDEVVEEKGETDEHQNRIRKYLIFSHFFAKITT